MRRVKLLVITLFLLLGIMSSGCVPLLVGGAAAIGTYAVSSDSMQGDTDTNYDDLWKTAQTVIKTRGSITAEDKTKGHLEAEIEGNRVIIKLIRVTKATTRLRISARNKFKLPNIKLAQEIFVKVLDQAS